MKCTNCGTELMTGAKFCFMCGEKVEDVCPSCGAKKAASEAKFCMMCGHKFDQAAPAAPAAKPAVAINRAPKLPAEMRASYSNYQTFANWKNYSCRQGAGNPDAHYMLDSGSLLEVTENGADAKVIKNLPCRPEMLFWADGKLWLTEYEYYESYRIYHMDPDTYECELEVDLSAFAKHNDCNAPYITESSIYVTMSSFDENTTQGAVLIRWDRKKGKETILLKAEKINIKSFGDKVVWAEIDNNDDSTHIIVDHKGKITPFHEHPDFAPLLPALPKTFNTRYYSDEHSISHIKYVDFSTKKIYCCKNAYHNGGCLERGFCVPFGASSISYGDADWSEPFDFDKVTLSDRDRKIEHKAELWYCMMIFDGKHAVGQFNTGGNFDWGYQTSDGAAINLGRFDRCENKSFLLGDYLYIYGYSPEGSGWHKFHLLNDGPQMQFVKVKN